MITQIHPAIVSADRQLIFAKLTSWLNQRKQAVKLSPDKTKVLDVAKLQVLVSNVRYRSLEKICVMVKMHRAHFEAISPGTASGQRNYYDSTIKPILDYCEQAD